MLNTAEQSALERTNYKGHLLLARDSRCDKFCCDRVLLLIGLNFFDIIIIINFFQVGKKVIHFFCFLKPIKQ